MFCARHINMMWCVYMPTNVHDVRVKCHAVELMCMIWCAMSHTIEHTGYQQVHGCMRNVLTTKTARPLLPCCWGYSLGLFLATTGAPILALKNRSKDRWGWGCSPPPTCAAWPWAYRQFPPPSGPQSAGRSGWALQNYWSSQSGRKWRRKIHERARFNPKLGLIDVYWCKWFWSWVSVFLISVVRQTWRLSHRLMIGIFDRLRCR